MLGRSAEIWLAAIIGLLSLLALAVWIPNDAETGMIETFRRQTFIGDAFIPMIAAAAMLICAVIQLLLSILRKPGGSPRAAIMDGSTLAFFGILAVIIALSLVIMYWAGPAAVALFGPGGEEPATYRQLRATAPWNLIGFALGGFLMVFLITSLIEGRASARRVLSTVIAVAVLIIVFDVPFDNLLLPPNGDW